MRSITTRSFFIALGTIILCASGSKAQTVELTETGGKTEVTEGGANDYYTVVLSAQPTANVTVTLTLNTAEVAADKTVLTFTSTNWASPQNVTVTAVDDLLYEGLETSTIIHTAASSDPAYNGTDVSDVVVSIIDNDDIKAAVSITESNGKTEVVEGGATDNYNVVLNTQPSANVTVNISIDSAQLGVNPTILTFTPTNWASAQSVTITAVDDSLAEGLLILPITHASASADPDYNALFVPQLFVNIVDNDSLKSAVMLAESDGNTEVTEGGAVDSYFVVLSTQPSSNVTINLSSDPSQVIADKSVLTYTPANWNVSQTVTVTAVNDYLDEGLLLSVVSHTAASSDPDYNGLHIPEVIIKINDNDKAGATITQSGEMTAVVEGGTNDSYQLVLDTLPSANVTITVTAPMSQLIVAPASLTFTPGNWNIGQTVTVSAVEDTVDRGTHATINHIASSADENYSGISLRQVVVSVLDNDHVTFEQLAIFHYTNAVRLEFKSIYTNNYRIEYNSDLSSQNWQRLRNNIPGNGALLEFVDLKDRPTKFYRLVVTGANNINPDLEQLAIFHATNVVKLVFNSLPNHYYRIEHNADLSSQNWQELRNNIPGNGASLEVVDSIDQPTKFYRLKMRPSPWP